MTKILEVNNLNKSYTIKKIFDTSYEVKALGNINFTLNENQTLGIVGESGCGKSTLAKVLTKLEKRNSGDIVILGKSFDKISNENFFSTIQMVFQDPYQSLNPRKKAFDIIASPLRIEGKLPEVEIAKKVYEAMGKVGLREELASRYPHQFSGGQRQRLGIARALMLKPKILILDEPVSALDVSIGAQVLNLLLELQSEYKFSYLFISHDLSVIQHMSDSIMVMYLGRIVEYGPRDEIFSRPQHPYTKALLESAPKTHPKKEMQQSVVKGELPSALNLPNGCAFEPRCPIATARCRESIPELMTKNNSQVACFEV